MKNLNYINCIEINEYDLIKDSKRTAIRAELNILRPRVNVDYNNYLNDFINIHTIATSTYNDTESSSLRSCYNGKTAARDDLIRRIIHAQSIEFQEICAYCLYHLQSTIDHYVPKEQYSEYSVLPKNLLPCCSICNGIKNQYWRGGNERWFVHFYNDLMPNDRFLIGALSFNGVNPVINYSLNQLNINNQLFNLIQSHFNKLSLFDKYSKGVPQVISSIKVDVDALRLSFNPVPSITTIRNFLISKATRLFILYGNNYWKAIVYELLANSNQFLNTL